MTNEDITWSEIGSKYEAFGKTRVYSNLLDINFLFHIKSQHWK